MAPKLATKQKESPAKSTGFLIPINAVPVLAEIGASKLLPSFCVISNSAEAVLPLKQCFPAGHNRHCANNTNAQQHGRNHFNALLWSEHHDHQYKSDKQNYRPSQVRVKPHFEFDLLPTHQQNFTHAKLGYRDHQIYQQSDGTRARN